MTKTNIDAHNKEKLLTLDDLYAFYMNQNKGFNFSAKQAGYSLSVQVPATFEVESKEDGTLLFGTVKLMHSGENLNHSNVTDEALVKAGKTLAYKPILANFMEYTDEETGETLKDFTSHDMVLNDDGTVTYIERQVGCFTSDKPYYEIEEETGHNFLYGKCAIPIEYTDTCDILKRKGGAKISAELAVNAFEFDADKKILNLTDVEILGATLLGKDPKTLKDVGEGMKNARLSISDFSIENNGICSHYESQLSELQEKIKILETNYSKLNKAMEGGNGVNMDKLNELLEKYGKTIDDIDFDYENMTDEELENKFAEVFGEIKEDNACGGGSGSSKKKKKNSTESSEDMVRSFSISHEDIRYALYNLLDAVSADDNDWYCITSVFDDYFIYENWNVGKIFGQKYSVKDDTVAFDGDRYELFKEYLNADEKNKLETMRSNYASIVAELDKYKSEEAYAEKMAVFDDEAYADYLETEEFKSIMSKDFVSKYSKDELAEKADAVFAKIVKKNKTFSLTDNQTKRRIGKIKFDVENQTEETYKPYGDLFD